MADVTEIKSVAALRKQTILFTEPVMSSHGGRLWCGPLNEGPLDAAVHLNAKHLLLWGLKYYGSVRVLL